MINRKNDRAEYGVGGGIVWDSDLIAEFNECRTKVGILGGIPGEFKLFETMLRTAEKGYFLLNLHLKRLEESASYINFSMEQVLSSPAVFLINSVRGISQIRITTKSKGQMNETSQNRNVQLEI